MSRCNSSLDIGRVRLDRSEYAIPAGRRYVITVYYTAELRLTQTRRHLCERASRQLDSLDDSQGSSKGSSPERAHLQQLALHHRHPAQNQEKMGQTHRGALQNPCRVIGHGQPRRLVLGDKPTIIRSDNASSVRVANDPKSAGRLRHAMRRFAVLQEGVKEGKVKIVFVPDADGALLAGQERE